MIDRLVLHVGMHKTGTTAIQEGLNGYDADGIRYARMRHSNHSIQIVTCFSTHPQRYHVWQRLGYSPEAVFRLRDQMRAELDGEFAGPLRSLIISGEEISLLAEPSAADLAAYVTPRAGQVDVLAYVRDPAGYISSAFQQMVRGGQASLTMPRPNYRTRFEKFIRLFGADTLRFRHYRPDQLVGGSAIADFAAQCGLPVGAVAERQSNSSLSADAVRLVFCLNRSGIQSQGSPLLLGARSALIRHFSALFPGRFSLTPEMAAGGLDPADIEWMQAVSGFDLRCDSFPDASTGERALNHWLGQIAPDVIEVLRDDLATRAPGLRPEDDLTALVGQHFQACVEDESARQVLSSVFRARARGRAVAGGDDSAAPKRPTSLASDKG